MGAPGGINHRERLLVEAVERKLDAIRKLRLALRGLIPHADDGAARKHAEAILEATYAEGQR